MEKCHNETDFICGICGNETDFKCRDCGEPVCDNCTMPYNQFTQIDYTLCKRCGGIREEMKAEKYYNEDQEKFLEKNNDFLENIKKLLK